jgi:hyperosmotically inducible periplasmic protein
MLWVSSVLDNLIHPKSRRSTMKNLFPLLIGAAVLIGAAGCENVAKTSADAPNSMSETAQAPDVKTAQQNQEDATSETRKQQLTADIRAREQRNNAMGDEMKRDDSDIKSEVRSKLEANLPASQLAVDSKEGAVTIMGTVPTQQQLQKIRGLAMEIKGVRSVTNQATVAAAQPNRTN